MYQSTSYIILTPSEGLRTYSPKDVRFTQGKRMSRNKNLDEHIESIWEHEQQKSLKECSVLENGPLLRLDNYTIADDGSLVLAVAQTDYQEYKATCVPENRAVYERKQSGYSHKLFSLEETAKTFAAAFVPITSDGYLVLLERSSSVDTCRGFYNLPSGGRWGGCLDQIYYQMITGNSEMVFKLCSRIVDSKFNFQVNSDSISLLGLARTLRTYDYVLQFVTSLLQSSDDIQRSKDDILGNKRKYIDIVMIPFEETKITDFLNDNSARIPEAIIPEIVIAGAHKFGEEWPLSLHGLEKI